MRLFWAVWSVLVYNLAAMIDYRYGLPAVLEVLLATVVITVYFSRRRNV